jgi:KDO2-lipid IV(A) lauroyltransferase
VANPDSKISLQAGSSVDFSLARAIAIGQRPKANFLTAYDLYLILVCGLIKAADAWPCLGLRAVFARVAAFAAFQLARRRRRIREECVAQRLQLSGAELRQVVKQSFYEFWVEIFSLSPLGGNRAGKLDGDLQGVEHIQQALEKGKGVILWESSFFGRRVTAKRILYENGFSVSQIHNEHHTGGFSNCHTWISKHLIQPFFESCEEPFVREIIYLRSDSFAFIRVFAERLKHNGIICVSADGAGGHKFITVDFRGRTDAFSTGMISLARLSGATILPVFCVQQGNRPRVIIESPIGIEQGADRERTAERSISQYVHLLETYTTRYPAQYRHWYAAEHS